MTWGEASEELVVLAERLESKAHRLRKVHFREAHDRAERLIRLAIRCRRLARNRMTLPGMADDHEDAALHLYEVFSKQAENMLRIRKSV